MPLYRYQFVGGDGRIQNSVAHVKNEVELEESLHARGLWLLDADLDEKGFSEAGRKRWFRRKVPRRDLIEFTVQMHTQLEAGVAMVAALESSAEEVESEDFKKILASVAQNVEAGTALHEAMARHPEAFSKQMVSMVRAGEQSGNLPENLREMRSHLEWLEQLASDIKQAIIYPCFVLIAIALFVLLLFSFVVPKFMELLTAMNTDLPMLTRIVFNVSGFAKATWWIWILLIVVSYFGVKLGRRYSKRFAWRFDDLKLKLPLFGEVNAMVALYRFSHNLGILFKSGVPILEAISLTREVVGNEVIKDALEKSGKNVENGEPINKALRQHPVFPSLVIKMVAVGEETGRLDELLEMVSHYYSENIPRKVKKLFGYLEPSAILFLVGIVGIVALAVFLPILSIMDNIQGR